MMLPMKKNRKWGRHTLRNEERQHKKEYSRKVGSNVVNKVLAESVAPYMERKGKGRARKRGK